MKGRHLKLLWCAALVLASCASQEPRIRSGTAADAAGTPKVLRIGMQAQAERHDGIIAILSGSSAGGSSALEHELTFHADLTTLDPQSILQPRLAVQLPSLEDGNWMVYPDGRSEVTWKLRPNVRWHDGTPLTAGDFVFGTGVARDPALAATPRSPGTRLLTDVVALDDLTFIVKYPQPFVNANTGVGTPALPAHILLDAFQRGDRQAFESHPYWTTDFVGLGPYRVGTWERSSHLEGLAFDQYFLGRPLIDRIVIRYFGDVNTMIAAMLAGDLDVLPAGAQLDTGQLVVMRDAWAGSDEGTVLPVPKGTRNIIPQMRDPGAPWARDVRVRQAIAHTVDRQLLVDTLLYGFTAPAYTSITPELPAFRLLERRGLPKFEFDPVRAERLLAEAGWSRGANRVFVNAAGRPFAMEVMATAQADNVKEIETLAAHWSEFGIQSSPVPLPPAASNIDELRATYPGMFVWPASSLVNAVEGLTSETIPSERTRWKGRNYGGYSNVAYDQLYTEYNATLDPARGQSLLADMMKIAADDVAVIPMYYAALGLAIRKGVTGPGPVAPNQAANAWNIHKWTKDPAARG